MSETIAPEIAEELYDISDNKLTENGEWMRVTKVDGDNGRWRQYMELVIQRTSDGTHWAFGYEIGLTENCEHSFPWRREWGQTEASPVEIERVYPHEVTTVEWRTKP